MELFCASLQKYHAQSNASRFIFSINTALYKSFGACLDEHQCQWLPSKKNCPLTNRTNAVWMDTVYWPAPAHKAKAQFNLHPMRGQFGSQDLASKAFGQGTVTQQSNTPLFSSTCKYDLELAIRHIHSKRHTSEHMEHI